MITDKQQLLQKLYNFLGNKAIQTQTTFKCGECGDCLYVGDSCDWNGEDATYIEWREIRPDKHWSCRERDGHYKVIGKYTNTRKLLRRVAKDSHLLENLESLMYALERTDPESINTQPHGEVFEFNIYYKRKAVRERTSRRKT